MIARHSAEFRRGARQSNVRTALAEARHYNPGNHACIPDRAGHGGRRDVVHTRGLRARPSGCRACARGRARPRRGRRRRRAVLARRDALLRRQRDGAGRSSGFARRRPSSYAPAEFQMGQLYDFGFGVGAERSRGARLVPQGGRARQRRRPASRRRLLPERTRRPGRCGRGRALVSRAPPMATTFARNTSSVTMYFDGTGVTRDYASAYVWFSLAAGQTPLEDNRKGTPRAAQHRRGADDAGAVAEAARRVAAWRPPTAGRNGTSCGVLRRERCRE